MILVIYSAWASPFELAFKKVATGSLMPVDLTVDAFFAADIILTFFVAYLDKSTYLLVDDHKKIAIRYATTLLNHSILFKSNLALICNNLSLISISYKHILLWYNRHTLFMCIGTYHEPAWACINIGKEPKIRRIKRKQQQK